MRDRSLKPKSLFVVIPAVEWAKMSTTLENKVACASIILFEVIMMVVYGLIVKYDAAADLKPDKSKPLNVTIPLLSTLSAHGSTLTNSYPMFQDVHVMIFIGFGFLMTFLKKYAHSALGFSFLLSCIVMQWDIIMEGVCHLKDKTIYVTLTTLIDADIAAAAVLISFGAVLGKTSPLQLFYMAIFETATFAANKYVMEEKLKVVDVGGSMIVHQFGAYFGLAVSFVMGIREGVETDKNPLESSTYQSDTISMLGTLFLWVYWPSFNGVLASSDQRYRAIINTYLSLTASCLITFAMSVCLNKNWKFDMFQIQNATLAGGVAVGSACNLNIHPLGALVVGACGGFVSVLGFRYIKDFLHVALHIHDTCGVHNLHGIPGILGGIVSAIMAMITTKENLYGPRFYDVYAAMLPEGSNRSASVQGGYQFAGIAVTFVMAVGGGIVTGIVVGLIIPNITPDERYKDDLWWDEEETSA